MDGWGWRPSEPPSLLRESLEFEATRKLTEFWLLQVSDGKFKGRPVVNLKGWFDGEGGPSSVQKSKKAGKKPLTSGSGSTRKDPVLKLSTSFLNDIIVEGAPVGWVGGWVGGCLRGLRVGSEYEE